VAAGARCPVIALPHGVESSLEALLADASSARRSSQSLAPHS